MKKTKFSKKEIKEFSNLLKKKRKKNTEELKSINSIISDQKKYIAESDMNFSSDASKIRDKEMLKRMRTRMVRKDKRYNDALDRIKLGTYGRDIRSGKMISKDRLLVKPEATRSIMKKK